MRLDLVIVGSGFGGSILAMVARRLGLRVGMIEKGRHPRFAIGESTSPLTNLLIESLSRRYDLPRLMPLTTWGAWKAAYPGIGVGLKRGFTYYAHQPGERFGRCPRRTDQLAVAASPADPCADTHWLRADVDAFLVQEAIDQGAFYADQTVIESIESRDRRWQLRCRREETAWEFEANFLVDASGRKGQLADTLGLKEIGFAGYPATQGLYSHFVGVKRTAEMDDFATPGDPPYPLDASALHHVFPGGWMWVLPFDNGVVSAGFACDDATARSLELDGTEDAWRRFLARFPSVGAQFAEARPVQPWVHAPRLAFRLDRAAGVRAGAPWALLPSAAGFVDALYSTGFSLTLLGIERLARLLEKGVPSVDDLAGYEATTFQELDWVSRYVAGNWGCFDDFPRFVETSMFYFAAASFSEIARRVEQPERAAGYLLAASTAFRTAFEICQVNVGASVARAIAPWNVAGLADPRKGNWYGVDLGDVIRAARKFEISETEMAGIVRDADWARCV